MARSEDGEGAARLIDESLTMGERWKNKFYRLYPVLSKLILPMFSHEKALRAGGHFRAVLGDL